MTEPNPPTEPRSSADASSRAAPDDPSGPSLHADPDRPADSGWREPAWFPPRDRGRRRERRPTAASVVVGLAFIVVGIWFFLDRTLGIEMPRIEWNKLWPVLLVALGALVLVQAYERRS